MRVLRLGYSAGSQTVAVTPGATVELQFALPQTAVSLEQVVTTATGETERKREIGSAVATLTPKTEELAAAQNVNSLTGKVAGAMSAAGAPWEADPAYALRRNIRCRSE